MSQAAVSVVVPVYNGARTLSRALNSIFAQEYDGFEVIVVDDGSTDETSEILRGYGDRLRVIRQENRGPAAARNAGVAASRAEYVALLDSDDVWLPGRLTKTLAALDREPTAALAYTDAVLVDDTDEPLGSLVPDDKSHPPSFEELMAVGWPVLPSAWSIRRQAYLAHGGFCESFRGCGSEDIFFFLNQREHGPFVYVPDQLVRYRYLPYLDRMEKYARGFATLAVCMRARYGAAGDASIRARAKVHNDLLKVTGMRALAEGRLKVARRAFWCAMRYQRPGRREIFRLLRAYLPKPLAVGLTNPSWASATLPGNR